MGPTREPLLWWKENEVDFGDFAKALRRGAEEMTFSFGFTDPDATQWQVKSSLCSAPQSSRVHRVELQQGEARFTLTFGDDGMPGRMTGSYFGDSFTEGAEEFLPRLPIDPSKLFAVPSEPESPTKLLEMTEDMFHGNTELERRRGIVLALPWDDDDGVIESLESRSLGQKFHWEVSQLKQQPERILAIRRARFCWWALERLRQAELLVEEMARRSVYMGPFRAVPSRGYRPSGSAVEQIDSRGGNLALFLVALSPQERQALNDYLARSLGFRVHTKVSGAQWELQVELADGATFELPDVGFGYSQVLPVAVQLWASSQVLSTSRSKERVATIVIEQPELHLHPHQQVLIARALGACAALDQGPVQIVETHSDHLVGGRHADRARQAGSGASRCALHGGSFRRRDARANCELRR